MDHVEDMMDHVEDMMRSGLCVIFDKNEFNWLSKSCCMR